MADTRRQVLSMMTASDLNDRPRFIVPPYLAGLSSAYSTLLLVLCTTSRYLAYLTLFEGNGSLRLSLTYVICPKRGPNS